MVTVATKVTDVPAHILLPGTAVIETEGTSCGLMVRSVPLSAPVKAVLVDTVLNLYPVPPGCAAGMVQLMAPLVAVLTKGPPMVVGVAKEPVASLNCTVNWLPALNTRLSEV